MSNIKTSPSVSYIDEKVLGYKFNQVKDTSSNIPYTWAMLKENIYTPQELTKTAASCLAVQTSGKKTKDAVLLYDSFNCCWIDIDDVHYSLDEVVSLVSDICSSSFIVYSSASSCRDKKGKLQGNRWRVIILLEEEVDANTWLDIQKALCSLCDADKSATRVQQILFLPNNPFIIESDVEEQVRHYEYSVIEDKPLLNSQALPQKIKDEIARDKKQIKQQKLTQRIKQALKLAQNDIPRTSLSPPDVSGIDTINSFYNLHDTLLRFDYDYNGKAYGSPKTTTPDGHGLYTTKESDERWVSFHGCDTMGSYKDGVCWYGDTFDVLVYWLYDGNVSLALKTELDLIDPDGQKSRQKEYMEQKNSFSVDDFETEKVEAKKDTGKAFVLPAYPEELLNLPYQLGEIQMFILNRMTYPSVATAGITALSTLTAFAQTNITIKSRDGLGLNEYHMVLAPTGFGKEDLRKPAEILDDKSDEVMTAEFFAKHKIGILTGLNNVRFSYSAPASTQGIHQILEKNRSVYFLSDEFAEWLKLSHKDSTKQAALGYFMQLYTKALSIIEPGHAVTNKYKPVKNPRVSILATSTGEAMFETMTREQADSGAYNRWIMFVGEQELPQKIYDGLIYDPEDKLVDFIAWIKIQSDKIITFSKEGYAEFKKLDQEFAEPIKRNDALLGGRIGEQSIKFAALIALSDKRFVMSASDIRTAFNIRVGLYHRAAALIAHEGNMDGMHSTAQALKQVITVFEKSTSVYKSQLEKKSRKYSKLNLYERKAVVDALISQGVASQCANSRAVLVSHICRGE
jgi:hypothetical protein